MALDLPAPFLGAFLVFAADREQTERVPYGLPSDPSGDGIIDVVADDQTPNGEDDGFDRAARWLLAACACVRSDRGSAST
jgi:hypothetical protein